MSATIAPGRENRMVRIVVPVEDGILADFDDFLANLDVVDVDPATLAVTSRQTVRPPSRRPVELANWVAQYHPDVVVFSELGGIERDLYARLGIDVAVPPLREDADKIARDQAVNYTATDTASPRRALS